MSNQNINVLLYTRKIHNSNTKNCANSVISLEPFSNIVFSKEAIIWIVQNYFSDKGLTQLRRYYIVNFTITNKKTALVVKAFKRVIDQFQSQGSVQDGRTNNKRPTLAGVDNNRIKNHFLNNLKASNIKLSAVLNTSKSCTQVKLKKRY